MCICWWHISSIPQAFQCRRNRGLNLFSSAIKSGFVTPAAQIAVWKILDLRIFHTIPHSYSDSSSHFSYSVSSSSESFVLSLCSSKRRAVSVQTSGSADSSSIAFKRSSMTVIRSSVFFSSFFFFFNSACSSLDCFQSAFADSFWAFFCAAETAEEESAGLPASAAAVRASFFSI